LVAEADFQKVTHLPLDTVAMLSVQIAGDHTVHVPFVTFHIRTFAD
jgi:hypothetical protein